MDLFGTIQFFYIGAFQPQNPCPAESPLTLYKKGKGFPYSTPSVGPGADPGVDPTGNQPAGDRKSSTRR